MDSLFMDGQWNKALENYVASDPFICPKCSNEKKEHSKLCIDCSNEVVNTKARNYYHKKKKMKGVRKKGLDAKKEEYRKCKIRFEVTRVDDKIHVDMVHPEAIQNMMIVPAKGKGAMSLYQLTAFCNSWCERLGIDPDEHVDIMM